MDSFKYFLATWLLWQSVAVEGGSWAHLPSIPTEPDRRAQYSLLLRNGGYKYGLDTGKGFWAKQMGDQSNRVSGAYQWTAADGSNHGLQYIADENGFQPQPIPSSGPSIQSSPSSSTTDFSSNSGLKTNGPSIQSSSSASTDFSSNSGLKTNVPVISSTSTGFSESGGGAPGIKVDASYGFSFNDGNYQRHETSDANSNVIGSYQYTSDNLHNVQYSAGADTGFVATVDGTPYPSHPVYPVHPVILQPQPVVPVVVHTHRLIPVIPAPVPHHPPVHAPHNPTVPIPSPGDDGSSTDEEKGDPTYQFSYATDTHSRDESSDAQGNVKGVFSFVDANGSKQTVEYEANNESGFVIKKVTTDTSSTSSSSSDDNDDDTQQTLLPFEPPQQEPLPQPPNQEPSPPNQEPLPPNQESSPPNQEYLPVTGSDESSNDNSDASYSFSYNAGDHSRTETSDSRGSVQGSYTFVAKDDGATRTVDYTAGAGKGFIAKANHLPTLNNGLTGSSSIPTGVAPSPSQQALPVAPIPLQNSGRAQINSDGSYTFTYSTNDHSRSESSDSSGNVRGFYTVGSADGGNVRRIDYTAGAGTGFVASGDGVAPSVPVQAYNPAPSVPVQAYNPAPIPVQPQQEPTKNLEAGATPETLGALDGSYQFAFKANDHSREEAGDSSNTVKGSYTYVSHDDKVNRRVDYVAGAKTGFIATLSELDQAYPKVSSEVSTGNSNQPPSISSQTSSTSFNEPAIITTQLSDDSSSQADGIKKPPQILSSVDTSSRFTPNIIKSPPQISSSGDTSSQFTPIIKSDYSTSHVGVPLDPNLILYTYLPPRSEKFGYILDTIH